MKLKPNQTAGLDGLTNEFYKCFWDQLSVLKDLQSFLSYIKKVKKMFYKNYRPTSQTNTDYKMIALFFSQRLQDDTFSNRKWTNSLYLRPFYRYQCAFHFKYLWLLRNIEETVLLIISRLWEGIWLSLAQFLIQNFTKNKFWSQFLKMF